MTHLVCQTCGYENWSWSAQKPDPIAADFRAAHESRGHQVLNKPIRSRKTS
jgi:hypothetical protein